MRGNWIWDQLRDVDNDVNAKLKILAIFGFSVDYDDNDDDDENDEEDDNVVDNDTRWWEIMGNPTREKPMF